MNWFRSNVRRVSRVALFAMAIQFALTFGHFHGIATRAAASIQSTQQLPSPSHDSDRHPDDVCAICAVVALASTAMAAAAPVILLPYPADFSYLTADTEFVRLATVAVAFQPRAPPVS
jgi:hypothetical protein